MIEREHAVESRLFGISCNRQRVVCVLAKRRKKNAELHAPAKATSDAPMAPERGPNIDGVTVIVGRAS